MLGERILVIGSPGSGKSTFARRLREKTEKDPSRPRMLLTVRGIGYRWEAENASEKG